MDRTEKLHKLNEAQEKLQEVIDLVEEVFLTDAQVDAYFLTPLRIRVSSEHGYLTDDLTLDDLMKMVRDEQEEA